MVDGHGVTVLVVDDESFVRMDLVDMLEAVGFRTREASSAAEAIEILEQGSEIRVVFTDIQMPGFMDGLALSHYVRKRWPPTVIVVCSGNQTPNPGELPSNANFIAKPFGAHELSGVLKKVAHTLSMS
jgi:CheY-like chemotaxis protein